MIKNIILNKIEIKRLRDVQPGVVIFVKNRRNKLNAEIITPIKLPAIPSKFINLNGKVELNTKTAIAHALSYPLTAGYGVAHGLACAFTLPAILEDCLGKDATLDHCFCEIFGKDPHEVLSKWFERIGISQDWEQFSLHPGFLEKVLKEVSTNPRAQNYLFSLDTLGERW